MRISDVSSDVCSSDLRGELIGRPLWDASWWRDDAAVRDQVREMVARAQEGPASRADIVVHVDDENPVTIDFQLVPIVEHGTVPALLPSGLDLTARILQPHRLPAPAPPSRPLRRTSDVRGDGHECASTCQARWAACPSKQKIKI